MVTTDPYNNNLTHTLDWITHGRMLVLDKDSDFLTLFSSELPGDGQEAVGTNANEALRYFRIEEENPADTYVLEIYSPDYTVLAGPPADPLENWRFDLRAWDNMLGTGVPMAIGENTQKLARLDGMAGGADGSFTLYTDWDAGAVASMVFSNPDGASGDAMVAITVAHNPDYKIYELRHTKTRLESTSWEVTLRRIRA